MSKNTSYVIDIIDVALDVVEYLNGDSRVSRASEIARALDVNRTRAFRILKTLHARGYVNYDPVTQGYSLGVKFLHFGGNVRERLDLRREAEPVLVDLAEKTGDSAHLLILQGERAVTLDRRQGENRLQVASPIGQSHPLYVGASPKILLAHLPDVERERIIQSLKFETFTKNTVVDPNELRRELVTICKQGYAVDEEDYEVGVCAIGAPVRDDGGRVIAGITITTPALRYSAKRKKELIALVVDAGQKLSKKLGFVTDAI